MKSPQPYLSDARNSWTQNLWPLLRSAPSVSRGCFPVSDHSGWSFPVASFVERRARDRRIFWSMPRWNPESCSSWWARINSFWEKEQQIWREQNDQNLEDWAWREITKTRKETKTVTRLNTNYIKFIHCA